MCRGQSTIAQTCRSTDPLEVQRIQKSVTEENGVSVTTQPTEIQVKWGKRCFCVMAETLGELRVEVERQTGILPAKQKLMGAKVKLDDDSAALAALKICKPLMLVGTPEPMLSNSSLTGRDARANAENESREDSPVLAKCARRLKVCFQSTLTVFKLDGSDSVATFGHIDMLPSEDKDTRKSYAQLHPGRIVPPGTLYAQEERAALPEPASYDSQEPQVLLAMVESGVYKIMGSKHRGLATSYVRANAGCQASSKAAESTSRKYWEQFEKELKPILSKACPDADLQI